MVGPCQSECGGGGGTHFDETCTNTTDPLLHFLNIGNMHHSNFQKAALTFGPFENTSGVVKKWLKHQPMLLLCVVMCYVFLSAKDMALSVCGKSVGKLRPSLERTGKFDVFQICFKNVISLILKARNTKLYGSYFLLCLKKFLHLICIEYCAIKLTSLFMTWIVVLWG